MAGRGEGGKGPVITLVVGGILLLVLLILFSSGFEVVDAGHRGVYTVFGDVSEEALGEGLHFKAPWANIEEVDVREQIVESAVSAASSDLQTVRTSMAVNYRPDAEWVWWLYQNLGKTNAEWEVKKLNPIIQESVKSVTAKYSAENLIKSRPQVKQEIERMIRERGETSHLVITDVNITDFSFSSAFDEAIESKVRAEQDALRAENELRREKVEQEKKVVQAEAQAKIIELTATANANAKRTQSEAEAQANRTIAESLDEKVLRNKWLEKWDGRLPKVLGEGQGVLLPLDLNDDE